jgi:hypothetical protein
MYKHLHAYVSMHMRVMNENAIHDAHFGPYYYIIITCSAGNERIQIQNGKEKTDSFDHSTVTCSAGNERIQIQNGKEKTDSFDHSNVTCSAGNLKSRVEMDTFVCNAYHDLPRTHLVFLSWQVHMNGPPASRHAVSHCVCMYVYICVYVCMYVSEYV